MFCYWHSNSRCDIDLFIFMFVFLRSAKDCCSCRARADSGKFLPKAAQIFPIPTYQLGDGESGKSILWSQRGGMHVWKGFDSKYVWYLRLDPESRWSELLCLPYWDFMVAAFSRSVWYVWMLMRKPLLKLPRVQPHTCPKEPNSIMARIPEVQIWSYPQSAASGVLGAQIFTTLLPCFIWDQPMIQWVKALTPRASEEFIWAAASLANTHTKKKRLNRWECEWKD